MHRDRTLQIALLVSTLIHSLILFQMPNPYVEKVRYTERIEVTYEGIKQAKLQVEALKKELQSVKDELPEEIKIKDADTSLKHKLFDKLPPFTQDKPLLLDKTTLDKKSVKIASFDKPKIENPVYNDYYQMIREKIRAQAYSNYTRFKQGEVYISFAVSSDGRLQEALVSEERSVKNAYLIKVALSSVKEASPFPPFPQVLNYPFLTFNVVISFEIED